MGELKSAWEIAQDKADRLGKLSAEELRQQREEQCRQIGQAIAQKYLDNLESLDLDAELEKHSEAEEELIKTAVAGHLVQALKLSSQSGTSRRPTEREGGMEQNNSSGGAYFRMERVIQGIAGLEPKSGTIIEQVRQLFQEYEGATREAGHEIERKGRETLHQLRISGTAVGDINVEAMPEWQQTWHRLKEPFEPRLDHLKQELTNSIVGSAATPYLGRDVGV